MAVQDEHHIWSVQSTVSEKWLQSREAQALEMQGWLLRLSLHLGLTAFSWGGQKGSDKKPKLNPSGVCGWEGGRSDGVMLRAGGSQLCLWYPEPHPAALGAWSTDG